MRYKLISSPPRLSQPRYSYTEADRLAGVSHGTSKRWLAGYQYLRPGKERITQPPVTRGLDVGDGVSFIDLVEIVAIGRLKSFGFSLRQVRQIVKFCQDSLGVSRPLPTRRFKVGGKDIFVDLGDHLLEVGRRKGMTAWHEVLQPFLEDLDYDGGWADRWWPLGREKPIVVDPDYGYGYPVVRDSGVRTEIILERFQAGDLEEQIAADFNITREQIERALQFELSRAA